MDAGCTRGHLSVLNVCCFWYTDSFLYLVQIKYVQMIPARIKEMVRIGIHGYFYCDDEKGFHSF